MSSAAVAPSIAPEDAARADLYLLIAHLFVAPPQTRLLSGIAAADDIAAHAETDTPLALAWRGLQAACAVTPALSAQQEYRALFEAVEMPNVPLQGSWYLSGRLNERPLAEVRNDLAELGLSRLQSAKETEDHVSALAETMHILIVEAGIEAGQKLERQRRFFTRHLQPWYVALADRIEGVPEAGFYRIAASLVRAFFDAERAQFETY